MRFIFLLHIIIASVAISAMVQFDAAARVVAVPTYNISVSWRHLLSATECGTPFVTGITAIPQCVPSNCNPPASNEQASFIINSTHAIMCGGFVSGVTAYQDPPEFVSECYFFSQPLERFVSKISNREYGRTSAAFWIESGGTAVLWSGGADNLEPGDWANYIRFNLTTGSIPRATNFSRTASYPPSLNPNPAPRSHMPYFRTNVGTYIFSAYENTSSAFRDLWYFSDATRNWTYINGPQGLSFSNVDSSSSGPAEPFVFHPSNLPRARNEATFTKVPSPTDPNIFYMFGGNSFSLPNWIPEFWAFNSSSQLWANYSSVQMLETSSFNVGLGKFSRLNYPTPRTSAATWFDQNGWLWMFGGKNSTDPLNDLWVFNPSLRMWALVAPNDGVASTCIRPARRARAAAWTLGGAHYLYGGSDGGTKFARDFWRLNTSVTLISCPAGSEVAASLCYLCENGTSSSDGTTCSYCPNGFVGNSTNGVGSSSCVQCPFGKYRSGSMSACMFCSDGFEPDSNYVTCVPCDFGSYSNSSTGGICMAFCSPGFYWTGSACTNSINCAGTSCTVNCRVNATTCTVDSNIDISFPDGGAGATPNRTVSITTNVLVTGNVSLSGSVTVTIAPGARLDVENCLTFGNGAFVEVIVSEAIANGTTVASFDPTCSTVPPVVVTSSVNVCQYGQPSTQVVSDSVGSRARLEVVFLTPSPSSNCNNGTGNVQGPSGMQTIGIIVGCVVGGLILILIAVAVGVPSVRHKIFPYSQRDKNGHKNVEMSSGEYDGAARAKAQPLPEIETNDGAESPMQRSWKHSDAPNPM